MEIWAEIPDFPGYEVSDYGRFRNQRRDKLIATSPNQYGDLTVGLYRDGEQHRLMAKRIVGFVFVEGYDEDMNDTAMLLDCDSTNIHHTNIVWRPRWFATTYTRQMRNPRPWYMSGPIEDRFGNRYENALDAARTLGVLPRDVVLSAINEYVRVPPVGDTFRYIK